MKKCIKVNDEKYINRKSPPYHANDCPNNIVIGNDDNQYLSKKDKNGIYKWIKLVVKKTPNEYYKQFANYKKPIYDIQFFTDKIS